MKHDSLARNGVAAQQKPSRAFNGVWIPASLWLRKDVTWFQKCLLAEIASFENCFASNEYLANTMGSTESTIANEISKLRKKNLILDLGFDGRKRFLMVAREAHPNPSGERIDNFQTSPGGEPCVHPAVNIDTSVVPRGLKESKEDTIVDGDSFSAVWKPNEESKEKKLKRIRPPKDYPSEREFDTFLDSSGMDGILSYRPDLYSSLCDQKWHQWKPNLSKWVRIRDWRKYVQALDDLLLAR